MFLLFTSYKRFSAVLKLKCLNKIAISLEQSNKMVRGCISRIKHRCDLRFFHPMHSICEIVLDITGRNSFFVCAKTCEQMQSTKNFHSDPLPKTEVARN